jgi:DNA polymerase III gamma/tau subunit
MRVSLLSFSHHANYIVGGNSACEALVAQLNKQCKIKIKGNPDFSVQKYETFTIDDARALKTNAEMRPVGPQSNDDKGIERSSKKIFIIQMNNITVEAQNALLKLLEEPADYVQFFMIIPSAHLLLPTVRSRMNFIEMSQATSHGNNNVERKSVKVSTDSKIDLNIADATLFINMSIPKRLDFIKKLMDDITKEKKTKQNAIELLNAIESQIFTDNGTKKSAQALATIEKVRAYINDRAPSFKMLLEYVALNI